MSLDRTDLRPRWPMEDVWTEGHPCVLQDMGPLGPLPKKGETGQVSTNLVAIIELLGRTNLPSSVSCSLLTRV